VRRALIGLGLFAFALAAVVLCAAHWIGRNLNYFKPEIERAVAAALHRKLHLEGDLALSLSPPGINIGPMRLVARDGSPFVDVREVRIGLDMVALAAGTRRIRSIAMRGVQVQIQRDAEGRLSIDDLLADPAPRIRLPAAFDQVRVEEALLRLNDAVSQQQVSLHITALALDDLAVQRPAPLRIRGLALLPEADLAVRFALRARLLLDAQADQYVLQAPNLSLDASSAGVRVDVSAAHLTLRRKGEGLAVAALESRVRRAQDQVAMHVAEATQRSDQIRVRGVRFEGARPPHRVGLTLDEGQIDLAQRTLHAPLVLTYDGPPARGAFATLAAHPLRLTWGGEDGVQVRIDALDTVLDVKPFTLPLRARSELALRRREAQVTLQGTLRGVPLSARATVAWHPIAVALDAQLARLDTAWFESSAEAVQGAPGDLGSVLEGLRRQLLGLPVKGEVRIAHAQSGASIAKGVRVVID
jgi:hypothetical protein